MMVTDRRSKPGRQERILKDDNGFYHWQVLLDDDTEWRTYYISSTRATFPHHYD